MFYYSPKPQTHVYTIKATANGQPVTDFDLYVIDDVSQMTADPQTRTRPQLQPKSAAIPSATP
jgi:hypothetical protein